MKNKNWVNRWLNYIEGLNGIKWHSWSKNEREQLQDAIDTLENLVKKAGEEE